MGTWEWWQYKSDRLVEYQTQYRSMFVLCLYYPIWNPGALMGFTHLVFSSLEPIKVPIITFGPEITYCNKYVIWPFVTLVFDATARSAGVPIQTAGTFNHSILNGKGYFRQNGRRQNFPSSENFECQWYFFLG